MKQMERVVSDLKYKGQSEDNELNEAKNMFDNERRKSVGIEEAAARLQKEHKSLADEIDTLKRDVKETQSILKELTFKYNEANNVIDQLED